MSIIIWLPPVIYVFSKILDEILKAPRKVSSEYRDRIIVSFFGSVSSGKSSGLRAVFGIEPDSIDPRPGTTSKIYVTNLNKHLSVADTPGLQDPNMDKDQLKKIKKFIDDTDIFVYVINAPGGGITEKEKELIDSIRRWGRPLLVVLNKIDAIDEKEREKFFENQLNESGVSGDQFIAVAFDPRREICEMPVNVDKVREWINCILKEKGEELLSEKREHYDENYDDDYSEYFIDDYDDD